MNQGHDLHIYISQLGDTMQSIAQKFSPDPTQQGVSEYLEVMMKINSFQQKGAPHLLQPTGAYIFKDSYIYLPSPEDIQKHRQKVLESSLYLRFPLWQALAVPNRLDWQTRDNLATALREHPLPALAGVASLREAILQLRYHAGEITEWGLLGTSAIVEQAQDYVLESARPAYKAMQKAGELYITFAKAAEEDRPAAKAAFYEAWKHAQHHVMEFLDRYNESRGLSMIKVWLIKDPEQWRNHIKLNMGDFTALTRDEFLAVGEAMKWARVIKGSSIVFSVAMEMPEIWHLYETGGDWVKKGIADAAGFAIGMAGSYIVAEIAGMIIGYLCLTPMGWIVILSAAAVGLSLETISKIKIEELIGELEEKWN
jgi:hypothetical protein